MAGIASKLYVLIKRGEIHKVQDLLGDINDHAIIADIENAFPETDPVSLAIDCRDEQLAIYLVEKGFSTGKLYQSLSERCDEWCLSHHRKGGCQKHFHRLKELIEAIRDGRRNPGDGLISGVTNTAPLSHPHCEKRLRMDKVRGVCKGTPKSAAVEAVTLLDRHGPNYVDKEGNTLLHIVSNSTAAHICVLANRGVPVNIQNNVGDTALHLAVRRDNFDCAEALIQCSADLSIRNGMGQTAVDEAEGPMKEMLQKCRLDPVQAVLTGNGSALINHLRHNWCSVLSIVKLGVVAALEAGHSKCLSNLLKWTWASCTTEVKEGKNLIQLAMSMSSESPQIMNCCRILQEHRDTSELVHAVLSEDTNKLRDILDNYRGYSVNVRFKNRFSGKTLLSHAIDSNNFEVVQLLVTAGAHVNQIRVKEKARGRATVPLFFKALRKDIQPAITQYLSSIGDPSELLEKDTRGNTALLRAIEEGASEQIISWLLTTQHCLNITQRNKDSLNARELAQSLGRHDIVSVIDKMLLQQRGKSFFVNLPVRFYGHENLQFTDEQSGKSFEEIVKEGRDVDDRKSITHYKVIESRAITLFEAAARGDVEQVNSLNVADFQDKNGYTALIRAIVFNQPDVAKCLCTSRPALKSIPDNCNRYPLHYASALPNGQEALFLRILLERNPELIEKKMDKDGWHPADYAKQKQQGSPALEQMLFDARTLDAYGVRGPPLGPWPEGASTTPPVIEE
ncbi:uncharacterized protein LOC143286908 isoform X2 [Babylonia areolata]|uniref:uncharacterized protein LOC143286908 isoform X2 n=1 Tax=Babylonia areolata TaxID=304850 RepID=UPI003FCF6AC6